MMKRIRMLILLGGWMMSPIILRAQGVQEVTVLFVGDLMMHMPQVNSGLQQDGSYCFDTCFQYVRPIIQQADLAIGNLETTFSGAPYSGYPCFSSPDAYLESLKNAGFDILTTANNHCCDRHRQGLERTIELLDSMGMYHLGTYANQESRQRHYPLVVNLHGVRIALLNATFGTNGIPVPRDCYVNTLDMVELALDIRKAKSVKPDVIIAILHWGNEYQHMPSQEQIRLAQWLRAKGVDHVIGSHPHVVQPYEVENQHLVAYSLGNFISNQNEPDRATGMMVEMHLQKEEQSTHLSHVDVYYTWVSRPAVNGKHQYFIYPIDGPDSVLNKAEIHFRQQVKNKLND